MGTATGSREPAPASTGEAAQPGGGALPHLASGIGQPRPRRAAGGGLSRRLSRRLLRRLFRRLSHGRVAGRGRRARLLVAGTLLALGASGPAAAEPADGDPGHEARPRAGVSVCVNLPVLRLDLGPCSAPPISICVDAPVLTVHVGACGRAPAAVRPRPRPTPTHEPTPRPTASKPVKPAPTLTRRPRRSTAPRPVPTPSALRAEAPVVRPSREPAPSPAPTPSPSRPAEQARPRADRAEPPRERPGPLGTVLLMVVLTTLIASACAVAFVR